MPKRMKFLLSYFNLFKNNQMVEIKRKTKHIQIVRAHLHILLHLLHYSDDKYFFKLVFKTFLAKLYYINTE